MRDFLSRYNNDVENMELFSVLNGLPFPMDGVWLAGGALRRTLIGDLLTSDFDFFFNGEESLKAFKKSLISRGAREISKTDHQETLVIEIARKQRTIQLVKIGYYETAEQLIDSFDFTITQFAYDGEVLTCGKFSLWDLSRRRLALHKLTYGVATMRRLIKYTNQNFTACAGVMQSILESVVANPNTIQSNIQYVD